MRLRPLSQGWGMRWFKALEGVLEGEGSRVGELSEGGVRAARTGVHECTLQQLAHRTARRVRAQILSNEVRALNEGGSRWII